MVQNKNYIKRLMLNSLLPPYTAPPFLATLPPEPFNSSTFKYEYIAFDPFLEENVADHINSPVPHFLYLPAFWSVLTSA